MNNNKRLSATTSAYATIATTNADTEDDSAVDINSSAFFVGTDRSLGLAESTQHRDLSAAHSNMLGKRVDTPTNRDSSSTSGGCGHSHSRALSKSDTGLESNQAATTTPNEPWRPESLSGEYVDDNFLAEFSINNEVDADDDADDNDSSENDDDNSNSNEDNNNDVDIHNDDNDDDDDEYESEDDDGTNDDDNNNGDSLNNNNNNASQDVVDRRVETRHDIEADSNRLRFERTSYEALVREDGRAVEMTPPIAVLGGEVCDIKIVPHVLASQASLASKGVSYHEALMHAQTFDVTWIDRVNGHAILEAKSELDCETQRVYHLNLVAIGCDGRHSKPVNVRVNVADVNEFGPQFMVNNNNNDSSFNVDAVQLVYVPAVSASVVGVPIAQLPRPVDHDCSAPNNQICRFQVVQLSAAIENADLMMQHNPRRFNRMLHQQKHDDEQQQQPMDKSRVSRQFGVDQDAKLYVRRKLVPGVRHELAIYAFDCAGRRSPWPANVTVFVMPLAPYKAANNTTTATTDYLRDST
ncbi:Calsyntenin-1, partial [Fragariocoptes setiger]